MISPNQMKKTKIVCTIGPKTESAEMLEKLLKAGMNVMRVNFSHGDFAEHQNKVNNLKKAIAKTGIPCAVLQDLSGPKFRLGDFYQERVQLKAGDFITLTTEKIVGDEKRVSVNYPTLHQEILPGNIIMVDDGKKKFEVVSVNGTEIKCKILIGGDTKGRRSLNLPGAPLKISALTSKDKKDIEFGIKNNVDIFAFSFVRKPSDVVELRKILDSKKSKAKIMAKIETVEAVEDFDNILSLVDMVMVARGDLAVELGHESSKDDDKKVPQGRQTSSDRNSDARIYDQESCAYKSRSIRCCKRNIRRDRRCDAFRRDNPRRLPNRSGLCNV